MSREDPAPPEGYLDPVPYPKPQRLVEALGLAVLIGLAIATELVAHFFSLGGGAWLALSVLVVLAASIYLHESVHYVAHVATGYDPTLRLWPPSVWSEGVLIPRGANLIHLSAPFIVLNIIGAALWFGGTGYWSFVGHFVVVENTAGSISDLFGICYNLTQKPGTKIAVLQQKVEKELVYKPETDSSRT